MVIFCKVTEARLLEHANYIHNIFMLKMLTLYTLTEGITSKSSITSTGGQVVNNLAPGIDTTGARTRVNTL